MQKQDPPKKSKIQKIYAYSSLGIQMVVIIGGSAWVGSWLDNKYETEKGWFALGFVILGIILAMYTTIKKLNKLNEE